VAAEATAEAAPAIVEAVEAFLVERVVYRESSLAIITRLHPTSN
jgi:hypothetical protein